MSHDASAQQTPIAETVVIDHARDAHSSQPNPITSSTFALVGAELLGSFLFVFVGLGVALYATLQGAGTLEIALGFGIALMAGIAAVGHVSGGHFNPAVTLGSALAGRTPWKLVPVYWITQIVGAAAAAAALVATIPKSLYTGDTASFTSLRDAFSITANGFGDHSATFVNSQNAFFDTYLSQGATQEQIQAAIDAGQLVVPTFTQFDLTAVAIIEVILTALFVGVVLAVTDKRAKVKFAPVIIGLAFAALLMVAAPLDGGSINPARSLAAALFSDGWALGQVWIFWVAPLVGAAIAALFYRGFASEETVVDYVYYDEAASSDDVELDEVAVEEVAVEEVVVEEVADADAEHVDTDEDAAASTDVIAEDTTVVVEESTDEKPVSLDKPETDDEPEADAKK